jgi:hypothetical protein
MVLYFKRVQQMKDDIIDEGGVTAVRPVKALLMELVGSHARLPGYSPEDSAMGAKVCKALKMVLGSDADRALRGNFSSKKSWDDALKRGFKRAAMEEACGSVGPSNTAAAYMVYMEVASLPYYLKRARHMPRFARSNTLYRLIHLRVGAHSLARRTCNFKDGATSPLCPCGCKQEEDPACFVYGCPTTEGHRAQYYLAMQGLMGLHAVDGFKAKKMGVKWITTLKWLNGGSSLSGTNFDKWLTAFLDMLAALLRVHPKWG